VQLQVADFIEPAELDDLLQARDRVVLAGYVDKQPAVCDGRFIGHRHTAEHCLAVLYLDGLQERGRAKGDRAIVAAMYCSPVIDLDLVRLALQRRIDCQNNVARPGLAFLRRQTFSR